MSTRKEREIALPREAAHGVRHRLHGSSPIQGLAAARPLLLTTAALAAATLLRMALTPIFGSGYTFITFYPVTIFATVIAGWRYGLGTMLASALLCVLLFLDPTADSEHATALTVFLLVGGSMIVIADATGRARRRAETQAQLVSGREEELRLEIEERKRMEQALRESEERFRGLVNSIEGIVWEAIVEGNEFLFTFVSRRAEDLLGYPIERWSAEPGFWADHIHPDDREWAVDFCRSATRDRRDHQFEYRMIAADGHIVWLRDLVSVVIEQGRPIRLVGVMVDISERKRAEAALRESQERLTSILNHAPAAIFIKDPVGRYLFMNEQCARVLSVNREQVPGHTDRDLLSPKLAAQFMANDQLVWQSGRLLTIEEQVPQADGVHTSLVQKFLLRDSQGEPYALCGIALDITSHLQLEAAMRASEARLQLAQSAANIGVFDWDIVARKGVWSPELERMWGLPVGSFNGTAEAWRRLVHPDDLASAQAGTRRSLENPTTASEFEYRIVRPDGTVRWIYAKAKTLCDAEGRPVRMVGVNLDITDRKEAQLRLERFAEELERQVASRTQELVNSQERLRAMATELNLAEQRERARLATELHDHLQQALVLGRLTIGQGKKAAAGVPAYEQVLKKVDDIFSGALTYTRTLVSDLSPPVLRDHGLVPALHWLGDYMQKHDLVVTVTAPDDRELKLPEDQVILLFQSVRELLINSSKHAGTGKAAVRMEQYNGQLQITVRDEGVGFDFAAAAAAAATTTSGGVSSKFGLFSIRERMRALGGSFELESAPGKGTTATLVLPLAAKTPVESGQLRVDSEVSARRSISKETTLSTINARLSTHEKPRIRVLLVDDHIMVRQGLRAMLENYPDVEIAGEAANGEEAIQLVERLRPGVVVMDINMPKMNGIEATMRIKKRYSETIIIGISVNATGENDEAIKEAGAFTLMTKEAAVERLYHVIHEAVKNGAAHAQGTHAPQTR